MHRLGKIDLVFSFFNQKNNRNTAQKQDSQIEENIHIGQNRALFQDGIIQYLIGFLKGFVAAKAFRHKTFLQSGDSLLHFVFAWV